MGGGGQDPSGLLLPGARMRAALVTASNGWQQKQKAMEPGPEPTQLHQGTENERQNERERELYRVLLLVTWRRRERQIVSGLRRKNTEHTRTHTRTHT